MQRANKQRIPTTRRPLSTAPLTCLAATASGALPNHSNCALDPDTRRVVRIQKERRARQLPLSAAATNQTGRAEQPTVFAQAGLDTLSQQQKYSGRSAQRHGVAASGRWFVPIQTEREVDQPLPEASSAIGIDGGIVRFATLSDGSYLAPLNSFKRHETALKKTQQSLSRKEKFSSNWRKTKRKVQRLHARHDYLHKATTTISPNHAMVCIEDLQVRNMSKSAPGRNVRAKFGLNKAILDQGWFECQRQLQYKLDWNGGILIATANTRRTCPVCGHVLKDNRQTQAHFACVECSYENNADMVGAINILRAGYARFACEVNPDVGDQQQEPAEVIQLGKCLAGRGRNSLDLAREGCQLSRS